MFPKKLEYHAKHLLLDTNARTTLTREELLCTTTCKPKICQYQTGSPSVMNSVNILQIFFTATDAHFHVENFYQGGLGVVHFYNTSTETVTHSQKISTGTFTDLLS